MRTMTSAQARQNFAAVMDEAEPVAITRRGHPTKAVVDLAEFERYRQAALDAEFAEIIGTHGDVYRELADR